MNYKQKIMKTIDFFKRMLYNTIVGAAFCAKHDARRYPLGLDGAVGQSFRQM